jgi:hypothetical protein
MRNRWKRCRFQSLTQPNMRAMSSQTKASESIPPLRTILQQQIVLGGHQASLAWPVTKVHQQYIKEASQKLINKKNGWNIENISVSRIIKMGGISLIDVMRDWRGLLFFTYVFPLYHKGSPTLETACKKKKTLIL